MITKKPIVATEKEHETKPKVEKCKAESSRKSDDGVAKGFKKKILISIHIIAYRFLLNAISFEIKPLVKTVTGKPKRAKNSFYAGATKSERTGLET